MNEFLNLCNVIGVGFAFAIGFRGFDACFHLVDSFLRQRKEQKGL